MCSWPPSQSFHGLHNFPSVMMVLLPFMNPHLGQRKVDCWSHNLPIAFLHFLQCKALMLYAELPTGQPRMGSILPDDPRGNPTLRASFTPGYPMPVDVLHVCQDVEKVGELEGHVIEKDRERGMVLDHPWFTCEYSLPLSLSVSQSID